MNRSFILSRPKDTGWDCDVDRCVRATVFAIIVFFTVNIRSDPRSPPCVATVSQLVSSLHKLMEWK